MTFSLLQSGFGDPKIISTGLRLFDISFLDVNMFRRVIMSCTNNLSWVLWVYCMEWSGIHISHAPWFFQWFLRYTQCVYLWSMCVYALEIKFLETSFEFIISMVFSDGELSVVVFFIWLKPDSISTYFLMLHACNDLKSIFLYLVCRKGLPFTKKKWYFHLWWCLDIGGGNGILGIVLWCSGILRMALPCIMGIFVYLWLPLGWCWWWWLGSFLLDLFKRTL